MADPVEHAVHTRTKYAEALSKHPEIEQHFPTYESWVEFMVLSDQQMLDKDDPEAVVTIDSVDQFARLVAHWHGNMLARLKHLREIPYGTEVELVNEKGEAQTVKLKGDAMKGHQAALTAAIAELEQWPFVMSTEESTDGTAQSN